MEWIVFQEIKSS